MMEMVAVWSCLFFHQLFNLSKGYPPIVLMGRVRVLIEFGATHQLSLWDKGTHYMIPRLPTKCPYGTWARVWIGKIGEFIFEYAMVRYYRKAPQLAIQSVSQRMH